MTREKIEALTFSYDYRGVLVVVETDNGDIVLIHPPGGLSTPRRLFRVIPVNLAKIQRRRPCASSAKRPDWR